jgi:hypothetical protein
MANVFAIASNDGSNHDIIREDGTARRHYYPFRNASVNDPLVTSTTTVPSTTTPAAVTSEHLRITGLSEGATVSGPISVEAVPASHVTGVAKIEFYVDGLASRTESVAPYCLAGDDSTACYRYDPTALAAGVHSILAVMHYGAGLTATASVTFRR